MEKRGYPRWAHFYLYSLSLIYLKNGTWELSLYIYTYIGILKKEEKGRIIKIKSTTDLLKTREKINENIFIKKNEIVFFFLENLLLDDHWADF